MFALGSDDSDSDNDVWVGPYTLKEAIFDVTRRRRPLIDQRRSCISSFSDLPASEKSSDKSISETSYTTACDTVHMTQQNKKTNDESVILVEEVVNSDQSTRDYPREESLNALTLRSSRNCNFQQYLAANQSSDKNTEESRSYHRISKKLSHAETYEGQAAEDFHSEQSSIVDLSEQTRTLKHSGRFNYEEYFAANQSCDKNHRTLESSYTTAYSDVHNRSNSKKFVKTETYNQQTADDSDSEQSSIDDLPEENLIEATPKATPSQNYNYEQYFVPNQSCDKNHLTLESSYTTAYSDVHNRSFAKKSARAETFNKQAAEDSDSEQSYIGDLQEENLIEATPKATPSQNYNSEPYFATNQSCENNRLTLESSYTTAYSDVHNRSNRPISKKLNEQTAQDSDSEQSSIEHCLNELSLKSKCSEDYSFQYYCDTDKDSGKNAQELSYSTELSITDTSDAEKCFFEKSQGYVKYKYGFHKKLASSVAEEVYSVSSSISEPRGGNLTVVTVDSDSSKCTSSSASASEDNNQLQYSSYSPRLGEHSKNSDSFTLDDTMEELNQFMQQGPDYVMRSTSNTSDNFLLTPEYKPLARSTTVNVTPESFKSGSTKASSAGAGYKSKLPTFTGQKRTGQSAEKSSKPKSVEKNPKSSEKTEFDFKVPKPPANRTPRPNLEHVVSPVGIYIKYSPRYSPLVKVAATSHAKSSKTKLFVTESQSRGNIPEALNCEIPAVIYKPAATRMVSEQEDVKLPNSIKKLVSPQVVTKHERRIERQQHDVSIERRLQESDLNITADNNNADISIVVNKQPFDIKKW